MFALLTLLAAYMRPRREAMYVAFLAGVYFSSVLLNLL